MPVTSEIVKPAEPSYKTMGRPVRFEPMIPITDAIRKAFNQEVGFDLIPREAVGRGYISNDIKGDGIIDVYLGSDEINDLSRGTKGLSHHMLRLDITSGVHVYRDRCTGKAAVICDGTPGFPPENPELKLAFNVVLAAINPNWALAEVKKAHADRIATLHRQIR